MLQRAQQKSELLPERSLRLVATPPSHQTFWGWSGSLTQTLDVPPSLPSRQESRVPWSLNWIIGDRGGCWSHSASGRLCRRLTPQPEVTPTLSRARLGCALGAHRRPPPERAGASLALVPARPGVCGPRGWGVRPGGGRAGRPHRPSLCERRLPWAAWRSGRAGSQGREQPWAACRRPSGLACPGAVLESLLCEVSEFVQNLCAASECNALHNLLCAGP